MSNENFESNEADLVGKRVYNYTDGDYIKPVIE